MVKDRVRNKDKTQNTESQEHGPESRTWVGKQTVDPAASLSATAPKPFIWPGLYLSHLPPVQ